jgi:hypothetical protein
VRSGFFYTANESLILLAFFTTIVLAVEAGFRLGRGKALSASAQVSMLVTSVVGVLALLLGFSTSMAVSRFEARRQLVIDEANSIETSYLRTQLLPAHEGAEIAGLLREYVDVRIRAGSAGEDENLIQAAREQAIRLQNDFWSRAAAYAQKEPNPVKAGLLLQSLNQSIDLASERWTAFFNHVPQPVIFADAFVSLLAAILVGYELGTEKRRQPFSTTLLALTITIILGVILELDRPLHGFIRVGQEPLIELKEQMKTAPAR